MIDLGKIDELATRLSEALPPGARRLQEDAEERFKAVLKSAFARMDLVTREEFEIQAGVLERTRVKLEALQRQLEELENALGSD
ncbi:MAG: accessory factor UbiK family protein [Xanthomonadales bacterium]|nr:accessory factor UbiK family protein [Xanthomonadales bacterium]